MQINLSLEDLAANAFIEASIREEGRRFFSYKNLERYGDSAIEKLKEQNIKCVLDLSRDKTSYMYNSYGNFFEEGSLNKEKGVKLREGVTIESLVVNFRGYIRLDVLLALSASSVIDALYS